MSRPVCPLKLALYGHPDAGGHWEAHCEKHLTNVGFERIPDWHSTFWHPHLKLLLVVYVDDFKLAGPKQNLEKAWKLIQTGIILEAPTPLGLTLDVGMFKGHTSFPTAPRYEQSLTTWSLSWFRALSSTRAWRHQASS